MDEDRMEKMRQALLAHADQGRRERAERMAPFEAALALRSDGAITITGDTLDALEAALRPRAGTGEAGLDDCLHAIGVARALVGQALSRAIVEARMK